MAVRRLPLSRIAGIAAWTAASVAWGTTVVAVASAEPDAPDPLASSDIGKPVATTTTEAPVLAPVPNLPPRGLVVVRYTPTDPPAPRVVVRKVVSGSPAPAAGAAPAPAPVVRETSSGS
jgi:hypothetical protein